MLIFIDPPFPGSAFTVGGDDASSTLTVKDGQTTYVSRALAITSSSAPAKRSDDGAA
jgi:hypothetical protein